MDELTFPILRWACTCGRFVAEQSITEQTYRDPGAYYGIGTTTAYDCSRCGRVESMPRLVEVGEQLLQAAA